MHLIWRCRLVSCLLLINPPPVGQTCCIYLVGTIGNYACFYSSRVLVAAVTASPATPAVNAYHGNPRRLHPGENKTPLEEWHKHHTRPRCRCALHAAVFPYHESVQSLLAWLRPHAYCHSMHDAGEHTTALLCILLRHLTFRVWRAIEVYVLAANALLTK